MTTAIYSHNLQFSAASININLMTSQQRENYDQYFESVLSEYHPMIARVVSTYEFKLPLQEELYQEISVALWKALAKFDEKSSLKTYLLSIAHKRAVSHVAKYAKEPSSTELVEQELPSANDCPSESLKSNQQMNQLMQVLRRFPMIDRQLVTLALEGVSYKGISEILGISVTNVGAKLNRAKAKLSKALVETE